MEHIAAVLLVIGCSNTMTECRELPVSVSVFETAQECTAERPFALEDVQGQALRIIAKCLSVDRLECAPGWHARRFRGNFRPCGCLERRAPWKRFS
jgi:hypothetical protein